MHIVKGEESFFLFFEETCIDAAILPHPSKDRKNR